MFALSKSPQCGFWRWRHRSQYLICRRRAGAEEDRLGEPFVGAAGKLLDKMLAAIRRKRDDGVYITNIVKCRPPDNRNPTPAESAACLPYLHRQIEIIKPRLIVALGRVAAAHLLQSNKTIGELRQRMQDYNGVPLVVTYHPAYLLRNPMDKRKSWKTCAIFAVWRRVK